MLMENIWSLRETYYEDNFGPLKDPFASWESPFIGRILAYQFPLYEGKGIKALVTSGMSDHEQNAPLVPFAVNSPSRTELLMYACDPEKWWLRMILSLAQYPFTKHTFLDWHHKMQIERQIDKFPERFTSLLFMPPFYEPEEFSRFTLGGLTVRMVMVAPITAEEDEFSNINSNRELAERFRNQSVEFVCDFDRKSLA